MKSNLLFTFLILACLCLSGCERLDIEYPEYPVSDPVPLTLTRAQEGYVKSGNAFAANLLDLIDKKETGKDYFFSPLSVQMALSMLLNGTDGEAFNELCKVLGYGDDLPSVNDYCQQMIERAPTWDPKVRLSFANAMIGNDRYTFKTPYADTLKNVFSAEVKNMDFSKSNMTLKYINNWCNAKTYGMIPKILDNISPNDVFVLMNALYFEGEWKSPFDKEDTKREPFHRENGKTVKVDMMNKHFEIARCYFGPGWKMISLAYGNNRFAMDVYLPDESSDIQAVINSLKEYDENSVSLSSVELNLKLPKFETSYSEKNFAEFISKMGARKIFDGRCLSNISDSIEGALAVIHKAKIKVEEEGTVAAATTAVIYATMSFADGTVDFFCDRPFLYVIKERHSGAIFFIGKYGGGN